MSILYTTRNTRKLPNVNKNTTNGKYLSSDSFVSLPLNPTFFGENVCSYSKKDISITHTGKKELTATATVDLDITATSFKTLDLYCNTYIFEMRIFLRAGKSLTQNGLERKHHKRRRDWN